MDPDGGRRDLRRGGEPARSRWRPRARRSCCCRTRAGCCRCSAGRAPARGGDRPARGRGAAGRLLRRPAPLGEHPGGGAERLGTGATVRHAEGVRITEDSVFTRDPQPHVGGTRSARAGVGRPRGARRLRRPTAAHRRRRWRWRGDSDVVIVVVGRQRADLARGVGREPPRRPARTCGSWGSRSGWCGRCSPPASRRCWCSSTADPPRIPDLAERVPAILECWYLGQEGGTAVAEVLFGDVNPGGKLPVTRGPQRGPAAALLQPQAHGAARLPLRLHASRSSRSATGSSYTTFSYLRAPPRPRRDSAGRPGHRLRRGDEHRARAPATRSSSSTSATR